MFFREAGEDFSIDSNTLFLEQWDKPAIIQPIFSQGCVYGDLPERPENPLFSLSITPCMPPRMPKRIFCIAIF